ncbi:hypothetical protein BDV28DRAFT_152971 [Aspergillus coremiiformis]|uniref:Uncharacterized protein n=1 Tax=Aspergillus coremiiformis TaxID=138285 RepID=A0A5N6YUI6_9EURO|nr:hypothetical protein BDV28DRAFT_152971 [Aspergillus coremiiformis]
METSKRQWEPTPSSLLWAHEIRRENIHLADEIHKTKAGLTSTVDTINDLKQGIRELGQQVSRAGIEVRERSKAIEVKLEERHMALLGRIDALETENGRLKRELEDIRRQCTTHATELSYDIESMKSEVMKEMTERLAQKRDAWRPIDLSSRTHRHADIVEPNLPGSDVLVPDSLPKDDIALMQGRGNSLRSLSGTTRGPSRSSSVGERFYSSDKRPGNLGQLFKQNARSLGDYWSYALDARIQLPLWIKSGEIAKAFVQGLDDTGTRGLVEKQLMVAGWSWDALADIMHNKLDEERKAHAVRLPFQMKAESEGKTRGASKDNTLVKHKKKKRRVIPIIPADEDDLREMGLH